MINSRYIFDKVYNDFLFHFKQIQTIVCNVPREKGPYDKKISFQIFNNSDSFWDTLSHKKENQKKFRALILDKLPRRVHLWLSWYKHILTRLSVPG